MNLHPASWSFNQVLQWSRKIPWVMSGVSTRASDTGDTGDTGVTGVRWFDTRPGHYPDPSQVCQQRLPCVSGVGRTAVNDWRQGVLAQVCQSWRNHQSSQSWHQLLTLLCTRWSPCHMCHMLGLMRKCSALSTTMSLMKLMRDTQQTTHLLQNQQPHPLTVTLHLRDRKIPMVIFRLDQHLRLVDFVD